MAQRLAVVWGTYADVCWRMLMYACWCMRMLTYADAAVVWGVPLDPFDADVCWRMRVLTNADAAVVWGVPLDALADMYREQGITLQVLTCFTGTKVQIRTSQKHKYSHLSASNHIQPVQNDWEKLEIGFQVSIRWIECASSPPSL
jgi:hypothetical protein